nr:hypothetical protein [Tanacetum cinerariifolium]
MSMLSMCSIASWNIRGLNFSPKQKEVRQMFYENKLSVCAILESHAHESKLEKLCSYVLIIGNRFQMVACVLKPYRIFDHSPAVLCLPSAVSSKPRPFKFTNILVHNTRFKEVVLNGWNKYVSGFHMFKVVYKLKCTKKPFRKLMYDNGNLHDNVKRLRHELDNVQRDLDRDPFNSVLRDEEALYVQAFNDAVLLEERFLKHKAKVDWLRDGDANTAYFHKSVKSRVAEALVAHYEMFLGQHGTVIPLCVSNLFQNRLDDVAAIEMIREVSDQEIKDAIFSMGNDKSPGPDGYTAAFFKEAWDIISKDIMLAIR